MIRVLAVLFALVSLPVAAQYPSKPVTMLAGYPPGGLVDIVARLVAEGMKPKFPNGIAVVNRAADQRDLKLRSAKLGMIPIRHFRIVRRFAGGSCPEISTPI